MSDVAEIVAAIRKGKPVVLPTDTVYGLACTPYRPEPVQALAELKRRSPGQPIALVAGSVDRLLECIPELIGPTAEVVHRLLPGPYTLVVVNPAARFPWLTGDRPDAIGVRVPVVPGPVADVLEQVRALAATSANRHGEPDPRRLEDVPGEIADAAAATLDGGELPGTPSTVLDLTGEEPRVLREGAVPAVDALAEVARSLGSAHDQESASADSGSREVP
jgi:L-threonylcarbamoyladenylate synthase